MDDNKTASNWMEIPVQQIKVEPPTENIVADVSISELFKHEIFRPIESVDKYVIQTKIVREDADSDEIIKEEPRFDDQFEVHADNSKSPATYSMDENEQKRLKSNQTLDKSTESCRRGYRKGTTKVGQTEPVISGVQSTPARSHHHHTASASAKSALKDCPTFQCFLCKVTIGSAGNLKRHYDRFHGEKSFRCHLCSKRFSVKFSLDIHQRSHSGAKPFRCKLCQRAFATQNNLRRHNESCGRLNGAQPKLDKMHNVSLECYLCKYDDSLATVQALQTHMIEHTGGNNGILPCNVCRRIFATQIKLAQHMLTHTKCKPFQCDTCRMVFTTKRNLKRHKRLHTRIGLFKCDQCMNEYTTKYARDAHQKKHEPK